MEQALPWAFQVGASVGEPQAGSARAGLAGSAESAGWVAKVLERRAQDCPGAIAGRPQFSAPSPFRRAWPASSRWKIERLRKRVVSAPLADSVPEAPCQKASSIARRRAPTQTVSSFVYTWQNFSSRNGLPPRFGSSSENPMPGTHQKLAQRLEIAEAIPASLSGPNSGRHRRRGISASCFAKDGPH